MHATPHYRTNVCNATQCPLFGACVSMIQSQNWWPNPSGLKNTITNKLRQNGPLSIYWQNCRAICKVFENCGLSNRFAKVCRKSKIAISHFHGSKMKKWINKRPINLTKSHLQMLMKWIRCKTIMKVSILIMNVQTKNVWRNIKKSAFSIW